MGPLSGHASIYGIDSAGNTYDLSGAISSVMITPKPVIDPDILGGDELVRNLLEQIGMHSAETQRAKHHIATYLAKLEKLASTVQWLSETGQISAEAYSQLRLDISDMSKNLD